MAVTGSRRRWPFIGRALVACPVVLAGCASTQTATSSVAASPAIFALEVPAPFDSTVSLARFALRAIQGSVQLPRVRPQMTSVSIHYTENRPGGGHTEIAIIAAVSKPRADGPRSPTRVELSAWLLDVAHQLTPAQRRAGIPVTAITTNAPALTRPRSVTMADTAHYRAMEFVLESFLRQGAKLVR